jgi:hypothetical protein
MGSFDYPTLAQLAAEESLKFRLKLAVFESCSDSVLMRPRWHLGL